LREYFPRFLDISKLGRILVGLWGFLDRDRKRGEFLDYLILRESKKILEKYLQGFCQYYKNTNAPIYGAFVMAS
jgi:hypothetical protein